MADDDTTTGDEPTEEARLARLESTQEQQGATLERIEAALARIVPGSHAEAEHRTEERLDRGSSLAEQVKAELAKAKQQEADAAAKDSEKSEREQMKADLAALREKPPAPPRNPVKGFATLGWGGDR